MRKYGLVVARDCARKGTLATWMSIGQRAPLRPTFGAALCDERLQKLPQGQALIGSCP
jgi:hypothetical protein